MLAESAVVGTIAAGLALGGGLSEGDRRRTLWGLAAASIPLGAGLWANAAALPELAAGAGTPTLGAGDLWGKLGLLVVGGLAPAFLAWGALRGTARGRLVSHGLARLGTRARLARGALVTLATVVAAGGSVAFLAALGAAGPPVDGLWSGASPALVLGLSVAAAVAEELLFRGALLTGLAAALDWRTAGIAQAGLFGLLHAGYGDPAYVAAAAAFGLVQAGVTRRWGLGVAVLVHAQVNVVILGWAAQAVSPVNLVLVVLVLGANLVLAAEALEGRDGAPAAA